MSTEWWPRKVLAPVFPAGMEPLPPGLTEEDRSAIAQQKKIERFMTMGGESCLFKTAVTAGGGFGLGAFISLMSATFAYDDPLSRTWTEQTMSTREKTVKIFKDMGKGMVKTGKGFGKVAALYAGVECVIEGYRAKNDMSNAIAAGFLAGGILARNSGPKAALGGGLAFAAFSGAIDLFIRRETAEYAPVLFEVQDGPIIDHIPAECGAVLCGAREKSDGRYCVLEGNDYLCPL